jgi:hypothetical protein
MPPEYYLGVAIAAIVVLLLGMILQRWLGTRFVVLHKSSGTDQLAHQLSRIADSLEKLVVHLEPSLPTEKLRAAKPPVDKPSVEKPSIPLQSAPPPDQADPQKADKEADHHVSLSMFGR